MRIRTIPIRLALAMLVPLAGCGDFLEVTNPGPIQDEALNELSAFPGLVVGMSADMSIAIDEVTEVTSIAADDLAHGGSYTTPGLLYRGIINPDDVNGVWGFMQRARWVAENGIERMRANSEFNFETSVLTPRAHLFAGFANRTLGENVCSTSIDGGPEEPHTVHFGRAEAQFTEALRLAQAQGRTDLANAALAGRASVRAWQGDWTGAAADASQVPADFVLEAIFSLNSSRENNDFAGEAGVTRKEYTVYNTVWAERDPNDPRAPWAIEYTTDGKVQLGQDGKTPFYRQLKYTGRDSEIPLAKGTEMLVLRAEAALRNDDIPGAMALINEQRDFYGMDPLETPATAEEAWDILHAERGAVLWLEGRRLWDLRRWFAESGPAHHPFLQGRDQCIPISENERNSNPNIS